jgi:hypothetical protein
VAFQSKKWALEFSDFFYLKRDDIAMEDAGTVAGLGAGQMLFSQTAIYTEGSSSSDESGHDKNCA